MTSVLILLSTWNGGRYLAAQLDSLLAQEVDAELTVLIRDDGSSDDTVAQIRRRQDPRIRLVAGENLGPRGSFFALLRMAQEEAADFVALCDQDDVWRPDKLRRAIAMLGQDEPGLYASSLELVDEDLHPIATFVHPGDRSFASTLLCNFVTGCTCVMNRAFLRPIAFPRHDGAVIMHDWWLASVATLGARIVYDRESRIRYRQHAANHVGIRTGLGKLVGKWRFMRERGRVTRFDHARQLLDAAGQRLSTAQRETLQAFLRAERSPMRRLGFVLRHRTGVGLPRALWFVAFG